jgi:hypothetical protein
VEKGEEAKESAEMERFGEDHFIAFWYDINGSCGGGNCSGQAVKNAICWFFHSCCHAHTLKNNKIMPKASKKTTKVIPN